METAADFSQQRCSCDASSRCWCVDCDEALCDGCVSAHRRVTVTRSHRILNQPPGGVWTPPTKFCRLHPSERLQLYCLTCQQLTCRDCQLSAHKNHRYQFIREALDSLRNQLEDRVRPIRAQRETVRQSLVDMETRLQDIADSEFLLRTQLRQSFRVITQHLKSRMTEILTQAKKVGEVEGGQIQRRMRRMKQTQQILQAVTETAEKARNSSDLSALSNYSAQVESQLKELPDQDCCPPHVMSELKVVVDRSSFETILNFGDLQVSWVPFSVLQTSSETPPACTASDSPVPVTRSSESSSSHYSTVTPATSTCPGTLPQTRTSSTSWKSLSHQFSPPSSSAVNQSTSNTALVSAVQHSSSASGGMSLLLNLLQSSQAPDHQNQSNQSAHQVSHIVVPQFPTLPIQQKSLMGNIVPEQISPASAVRERLPVSAVGNQIHVGLSCTAPHPLKDATFGTTTRPPSSNQRLSSDTNRLSSNQHYTNPPSSNCHLDTIPPSSNHHLDTNCPSSNQHYTNPPSSNHHLDTNPPSSNHHLVTNPLASNRRYTNPPSSNHLSFGTNPPSYNRHLDTNPPSSTQHYTNPPPFNQHYTNPLSYNHPLDTNPPSSNSHFDTIPPSSNRHLDTNCPSSNHYLDTNPLASNRHYANPPSSNQHLSFGTNPPSYNHHLETNPPSCNRHLDTNPPSSNHHLDTNHPSSNQHYTNPPSSNHHLDTIPPSSKRHFETNPQSSNHHLDTSLRPSSLDQQQSPVVRAVADSACDCSVQQVTVRQQEPSENEPTSTVSEEPAEKPFAPEEPEPEVLDREVEKPSTAIGHLGCSVSRWQPNVSLFRLPVTLSHPGRPLPCFHLVPGDAEDEIYLKEMSEDTQSHAGDDTDDIISEPPSSPVTLVMVACSACRLANSSIICSFCGRGYHRACHLPPVGPDIRSEWMCSLCQDLSDPSDPFRSDRPQRPDSPCLGLQDQRRCETLLLYLMVEGSSRLPQSQLAVMSERLCRSPSYESAAEFLSDIWSLFKGAGAQDDSVMKRLQQNLQRLWTGSSDGERSKVNTEEQEVAKLMETKKRLRAYLNLRKPSRPKRTKMDKMADNNPRGAP